MTSELRDKVEKILIHECFPLDGETEFKQAVSAILALIEPLQEELSQKCGCNKSREQICPEHLALVSDNDRLKREVEHIRSIEIPTLQGVIDSERNFHCGVMAENESLKKENAMLVEALETISSDLLIYGDARTLAEKYMPNAIKDIDGIREIAKQALRGRGK